MTKEQKAEERKDLQLEIKARRELLNRLGHPMKLLEAAAEKEKAKREERVARAREYATAEDAHEAFGWGVISEEEYEAIAAAFEAGEAYVENTVTPVEAALHILKEFSGRLSSEVRSFEFDLLPAEEQIKHMEAAEKHREEMEARRAARRGQTEGGKT